MIILPLSNIQKVYKLKCNVDDVQVISLILRTDGMLALVDVVVIEISALENSFKLDYLH